jgi:threonine dehydrogenase-like Zn-dependent dehydrogenase
LLIDVTHRMSRVERPLIVTLEERFVKAKPSDVASDIPDLFFLRSLPIQNGREPVYLCYEKSRQGFQKNMVDSSMKRQQNRKTAMNAVVRKSGMTLVGQVPKPVPAEDEALIKILKAGICSTDLEIIEGYMDFEGILGHEFVGLVAQSSDETWIGKRVVGEINIPCRTCGTCLGVDPRHCPSRKVLGIHRKDGVFAQYATLPLVNLFIVPSTVSDEEAVFVEPLAAALRILEQVAIDERQEVLVLGDGKLGLLAALVLRTRTSRVFCAGHHPRKLSLLERRGIETVLKASEIEDKFDVVIEATGNPQGIKEALDRTRPMGKIIAKSTFRGTSCLNLSSLVVDEIQLLGSRCGPFDQALDFLRTKDLGLEEMVDADFPLKEAKEAFEKAGEPESLKVLLTP